jgi:predicted nucleotidyltransferase component of viral defense system
MSVHTYGNPSAFKAALEQRIRDAARKEGMPVNRYRQRLAFDRFLGRLHEQFGEALTLKGGLALELRLDIARTTKDLDVRLVGSSVGLLERLQEAGRRDLGDWLQYEVQLRPADEAIIEGEGVVYEGLRFRAEARLAGKRYADPFPLDVAFGDILTGTVEEREGADLLDFIGARRSQLRLYPCETHVAEKLHAYTLPRPAGRPNTRVKDLVDIALLARGEPFEARLLHEALERTFHFRGSHALPPRLPPPPDGWRDSYRDMVEEHGMPWRDLDAVLSLACAFLDPVLRGEGGTWAPGDVAWCALVR